MEIAHRRIGLDALPFVIAEMSGNHNQSLDRALSIVDAAARAGAHALKLQTYTADTITLVDINERRGDSFSGTNRTRGRGSADTLCTSSRTHLGSGKFR